MQNQLIDTYRELMGSLSRLPKEIADVQEDLTRHKLNIAADQKEAETIENRMIQLEGGWAALGKNEGDRKSRLTSLLAKDPNYRIAHLQDTLAGAERQYGAHAALLTYLAGEVGRRRRCFLRHRAGAGIHRRQRQRSVHRDGQRC